MSSALGWGGGSDDDSPDDSPRVSPRRSLRDRRGRDPVKLTTSVSRNMDLWEALSCNGYRMGALLRGGSGGTTIRLVSRGVERSKTGFV